MPKWIDKVGKPRPTVLGSDQRIETGVTSQKGRTELDLILVGTIMTTEGLVDWLDPRVGRMMKGELSFWMTIWELVLQITAGLTAVGTETGNGMPMLCPGCIARTTAVGDGVSVQELDGTPLVGAGAGDGIIMLIGTIHGILGILGIIHGVTAGVGVEDTVGVVGTVGVTADGIIGVAGIGGVGAVGTDGEATLMFGFKPSPVFVQVLEGIGSTKLMPGMVREIA